MVHIEIVLIALGLAMDASAVSMAAAASGYANGPRPIFRLSFHFGLFQFFMPIVGWVFGRSVVSYFSSIDHWIAFSLLTIIGAKMIHAGVNPSQKGSKNDPSRGMTLVMLSLATSIDALAIGLSLAMLGVGIWYPSVIIGVVTAAMSLAAIGLGHRLGKLFGERMEIIGGIILIAIGLRILLSRVLT